jgi:hypothetical protein
LALADLVPLDATNQDRRLAFPLPCAMKWAPRIEGPERPRGFRTAVPSVSER